MNADNKRVRDNLKEKQDEHDTHQTLGDVLLNQRSINEN